MLYRYRDENYYSNMIIVCRISMFTVYYIVKNYVYSFINFNTCLFHKILSIVYEGVHFRKCYIERRKLFKYENNYLSYFNKQ